VIDGVEHPIEPGSPVYVGKWIVHSIVNRSAKQMKVLWVITPPGLEDFLVVVGPERKQGEDRPQGLPRPSNIQQLLNRAYFAQT
jgi:hypothetical protein